MKPGSDYIGLHIKTWTVKLGSLRWWPQYLYHFTDVQNAANILHNNSLCSRSLAERLGHIKVDSASQEIIGHTSRRYKDCVRLYFRPRTPTQFRNEGIRPRARIELGAHCPMPIFFCFDAFQILSMDNTEYSSGSVATAHPNTGNTIEFFKTIPFQYVFHDGPMPQDQKELLKHHRHAEVLIPGQLDLTYLKGLVCRSTAERETLLHLLTTSIRKQWQSRIIVPDKPFFERKWTYVEQVIVVGNNLHFSFNPSTVTPGPFHVRFEYRERGELGVRHWEGENWMLKGQFVMRVPNASAGVATLYLDGCLAYQNYVVFGDIPF